MAATIVSPAKSGSRVMGRILQRLARGACETTEQNKKSNLNISRLKRRCWYIADADPAVAAASYAAAPVQIGDLAYRVDSDEVFVCSVAPAAATNATFIQCHA
jgi:hypothetical protein